MPGPYSFETGEKKTFVVADYVVVSCTMAVSVAIGIFFAIKDRHRNTPDEYLLGGRNMHPIPVAFSLSASFISSITILGNPAEIYVNGLMYMWITIGFFIACFGAGHIFLPIYYNLRITSVFQYIEMRFGHVIRSICVILYILAMMSAISINLYAPSLAINAVTGLHIWGSVITVGAVCVVYTTIGGIKAVIWTDTLQIMIMYAGMLTMLFTGSAVKGGFQNAWNIAEENERTALNKFDPRLRHSTWSLVIGGGLYWCNMFGTNQQQVQRAMAVGTKGRLKIAVWLNLGGMSAIIIVSSLVGIVMFSFYSTCDPIKFGLVSKPDQIMPLFMMDLLWKTPGLPGFLLSTVFSASLSTLSSGLNALAAVTLEDFVKPICCDGISAKRATLISKALVIMYGVIGLALAFVVAEVGGLILQLVLTFIAIFTGPMFGLFTLGIIFPWANKWGGITGLISSLALMLWIGVGAMMNKVSVAPKLPVYTDGCNWNVSDKMPPTPTPSPPSGVTVPSIFDKHEGLDNLYSVSYLWYTPIAAFVVIVVGLVISFITGPTDPKSLNPKLISPVFDICFPCLPEKIRQKLRFGVRHGEDIDVLQVSEPKPNMKLNTCQTAIDRGHDNVRYDCGHDNVRYDSGHDNVRYDCGHDNVRYDCGHDNVRYDCGHDNVRYDCGHDNVRYDCGHDNVRYDSGHDNVRYDCGHDNVRYDCGHDNVRYDCGHDNVRYDCGHDNVRYDSGFDTRL